MSKPVKIPLATLGRLLAEQSKERAEGRTLCSIEVFKTEIGTPVALLHWSVITPGKGVPAMAAIDLTMAIHRDAIEFGRYDYFAGGNR